MLILLKTKTSVTPTPAVLKTGWEVLTKMIALEPDGTKRSKESWSDVFQSILDSWET